MGNASLHQVMEEEEEQPKADKRAEGGRACAFVFYELTCMFSHPRNINGVLHWNLPQGQERVKITVQIAMWPQCKNEAVCSVQRQKKRKCGGKEDVFSGGRGEKNPKLRKKNWLCSTAFEPVASLYSSVHTQRTCNMIVPKLVYFTTDIYTYATWLTQRKARNSHIHLKFKGKESNVKFGWV